MSRGNRMTLGMMVVNNPVSRPACPRGVGWLNPPAIEQQDQVWKHTQISPVKQRMEFRGRVLKAVLKKTGGETLEVSCVLQ